MKWLWPGSDGRCDRRLLRFQQILLAAQQTRGYRRTLRRAGLDEPAAIAALKSIEAGLRGLPCLGWEKFSGSRSDFHNPNAPEPAPPRLRHPLAGPLRTALLSPRFAESRSIRVFDAADIGRMRQFRPEAIAASLDALKRLAQSGAPASARAIVVFSGVGEGPLPEAEREFLWQAFETPIFEQRLGGDGALLAWECEAYEGLHIDEENAIFEHSSHAGLIVTSLTDRCHPAIRVKTGMRGALHHERCGCGRAGARIVVAQRGFAAN